MAQIGPELGLATAVTTAGLTTSTGYEAPGVGYLRRLKRTLPAGNIYTYAPHGATDTAAACGGPSVGQGGLPKSSTSPSSTAITDTAYYDKAGRPISTTTIGALTYCTTYDSGGRDRVTQRTIPASGAEPARTVTYSYAVGGDPLKASVGDAAGTITTQVDLLGRVTSYTDVYGNVTTSSFDQVGRATDSTGPAGTTHVDFDTAGQVSAQKLGGLTMALPTYNSSGEVTRVDYPSGTGNGGNASYGIITRDDVGRTKDLNWTGSAGSLTTDYVKRTQSGRVLDETIDGVDANPGGDNFTYDTAGRHSAAIVANKAMIFSFAPTGGCGTQTTAGANTNRTSQAAWPVDANVNSTGPTVTTTSCYNNADQVTSSDGTAPIVYDPRGNTTRLAAQTLAYDGADRNTGVAAVNDAVRYTRDATDRIVARTTSTIGQRGNPYGGGGQNGTGATTLTIPKAVGTATGDVMVAHVSVNSSTVTVTAPTDGHW